MKQAQGMSLKLIFTLAVLTLLPSAFAARNNPTDSIPNGYINGRTDVKYGTYTTVVQDSARPYQNRLKNLENKAYGLSKITGKANTEQSEAVYLLEFEVIRLHIDIANAPTTAMTDFERKALLYGTTQVYADVRHHSERLFENMVRYIDHKIPGPNGLQIREEVEKPKRIESIYYPNYRSDELLSEEEKATQYDKKLSEFLADGGSMSEIKKLTPDFLASLSGFSRFEYVQLEDGSIMVTEGKAGHLLLANGKAVKAAGQIIFVKNTAKQVTLMIISNASGSYKPDLFSVKMLSDEIQKKFNIPSESMILTQGEPLSTQAVKIYMKADKIDKELLAQKSKELEEKSKEILSKAGTGISVVDCDFAFSDK